MTDRRIRLGATPIATLAYTGIAIVMTWPLARHLHRYIAWDMGDPVLNAWILQWDVGQIAEALKGNLSALAQYWNANIFYPEPLALTYSEHLTPQAIQILPILLATRNAVLSYNLLFLSTLVLSGLGTFLLLRELACRPLAAFFAGLAFAYAPYHIPQFSHIQVVSSYWMPLTLYGFRRYFTTRRIRPLVGAAAALALQGLSCGYYLLFFPPFVAAYCVYEMTDRHLLRDRRVWRELILAAIAVAIVSWPFVRPYLEVRRVAHIGIRGIEELEGFSADTHAFVTPSPALRFWGPRLTGWLAPEAEGFVGLTIAGFAAVGAAVGLTRAIRRRSDRASPMRPWQQVTTTVLAVLLAFHAGALAVLFVRGGTAIPIFGTHIFIQDAGALLFDALLIGAGLIIVSPWVRRVLRGVPESTCGFYASATLAAALLALGPKMRASGRLIGTGPYYWLYMYVPGFDGLRVPGRFLMLVTLFLAVLAGLGAAAILDRWGLSRHGGRALVALACMLVLVEGWVAPFHLAVRAEPVGFVSPPRELTDGRHLSPLYKFARDAADPIVLAEFPFAVEGWELQYVFYAGAHRRPTINGYSGFFPASYSRLASVLSGVPGSETAWRALIASGATHAIVHEGAFTEGRGSDVSDWLRRFGATEIMVDGRDRLFRLK